MKKKVVYLWIVALCLLFFSSPSGAAVFDMGDPSPGGPSARPSFSVEGKSPRVNFSRLPLYFMANSGQVDGRVRCYARASGYTLWVTGEGLVFDAVRPEGKAVEPGGRAAKSGMITRDVKRLSFVDAVKTSEVVALEETGLQVNFLKGTDRSKCDPV